MKYRTRLTSGRWERFACRAAIGKTKRLSRALPATFHRLNGSHERYRCEPYHGRIRGGTQSCRTTLSSELWTCRPPSKPPGEKMRRNKTVIVIQIVFALLILYAIFGLIRKTVSAPVLGNGGGTHQASSHWTRRGHFSDRRTQHLTRMRKEEAEL